MHMAKYLTAAATLAFGLTLTSSLALAQQNFKTPDEAVDSFVAAVRGDDSKALIQILGRGAADIIDSGDAVADAQTRRGFLTAYDAKHRVTVSDGKSATLLIGQDDWPLPIPLMEKNGSWQFDTLTGRREILYRRIGRNELAAIMACLAYVDAQNDYAALDAKNGGMGAYAQKIGSTPGQKDGLYWPTKAGEEESPLGEFVAAASRTGKVGAGEPFYGYHYRILTRQGPQAAGGEHNYVVRGKMIGGFALVAWPAVYGNTGVMTFLVNQDGDVFQKDLGDGTPRISAGLSVFNPDHTWKKVVDMPQR